ncbi:hypothetical protein [Flavobacterium sp. NKUCC04_CG]|uniref:hypothetical protein n=1 Tax=Flavobacterium sp. NKUCC04_CG TaxID=2842121 RepID=UPI001C5A674A|nr:hypothetical protein [Flavobacterium sp. NKUCC04_CG]MBW3519235.1 hypothetical protein [Flavobacterium sp. NKUCC04_CG]
MTVDFVKPTVIFSIVGFFIPGFTAIAILAVQMFLNGLGVECTIAFELIWILSSIGALLLPFLFYRYLKWLPLEKLKTLPILLTIFNALEYVLIQSSLIPVFTNAQSLCYGNGGQNGLELVFTAWIGLPILILLSFLYNQILKNRIF